MKTHDEFVKNLDEKITRELYEAGITDTPDPWATVRVVDYWDGPRAYDAEDVDRARAAVEAAHRAEVEAGRNEVEHWVTRYNELEQWRVQQSVTIARLTQERDKYRNGIEAALDSNEATKVLKFRISGLNDELAAVKAERDALRMALDAAVTARLDGTPSGDWINRLRAERDALTAQIAGLREALTRARSRIIGVIKGDGIGLAYEAVDILSAALAADPEGDSHE